MNVFASQIPSMALLGSGFTSEVGLRVLLSPLSSNIVLRTAWEYFPDGLFSRVVKDSDLVGIICSIGIGLPVYSTFKAIENRDQNQQQKWLIYWAAFGSFSLVEVFTDKLISWYTSQKLSLSYHKQSIDDTRQLRFFTGFHCIIMQSFAFLVWLQLPTIDGAKLIYNNHLRPFLIRHQARVDRLVDGVYEEMVKVVRSHQGEIRFVRSMIASILGSANEVTPPSQQGEISNSSPEPELSTAIVRDSESESDHEE
ncbi:hypothetical protein HID58_056478 [Brassica napus]|uniref:HVA22-like protein n=1 Tax=Brassica napus TaxID=3708 RepID=A0ABQ8ANA6_BRANA|nr:hypothetical protein HID58_056478 [Brassica napus]